MNILLINHYAGSTKMGMEFHPYYLARNWVRGGHSVSIMVSTYSHLRHENPSIEKGCEIEDIDGIQYHWVKTKKYEGNGVSRAISMAQFILKIILHAGELCREIKPDTVIVSSTYPMDGHAARMIRRLSGAEHIREIHDMWPATLVEIGGMSKNNPFVWVN